LALRTTKYYDRNGAILLCCKFEIISEEMRVMEHFGFLIAPDAIVPFCLKFERIRRRQRQLSHGKIGKTNAVETRKNKDLRCFLRLDYA